MCAFARLYQATSCSDSFPTHASSRTSAKLLWSCPGHLAGAGCVLLPDTIRCGNLPHSKTCCPLFCYPCCTHVCTECVSASKDDSPLAKVVNRYFPPGPPVVDLASAAGARLCFPPAISCLLYCASFWRHGAVPGEVLPGFLPVSAPLGWLEIIWPFLSHRLPSGKRLTGLRQSRTTEPTPGCR